MAQHLTELVEQFCTFQRKQRGKTEGGVTTYRWMLAQFLIFVRSSEGRPARIGDLTPSIIQAWMDDMGANDLALSTMRSRRRVIQDAAQNRIDVGGEFRFARTLVVELCYEEVRPTGKRNRLIELRCIRCGNGMHFGGWRDPGG